MAVRTLPARTGKTPGTEVLVKLRRLLAVRVKRLERRWISDPFERVRHTEIVSRRLALRVIELDRPAKR